MDSLLPYYERELTYLRRLSHDFARRYPKVAGRLLLSGETCEDPHIERLIESFAFLSGRIHKKLDDEYPEFTDSLLQVVFPQYLRPFPSVSIAQFDGLASSAKPENAAKIPRNTLIETRPVRGVSCKFSTAYDVELYPVSVARAAHENTFNTDGLRPSVARLAGTAICIVLSSAGGGGMAQISNLKRIRFFLNGEPALVALVREAMFTKAVGIWVSTPESSEKIELPLDAIQSVGFAQDESLLEADARSHHAYQLMLEYFAFPEKFNFIDLDLTGLKGRLPVRCQSIEIRVGLGNMGDDDSHGILLDRICKDNFVLGCTPIVNLFRQRPEPIRMNEMTTTYPIIVDSRRPQAYEIYEIKEVVRVRQGHDGEEISEFRPFYSIRHGEQHEGPARYWHASYVDDAEEKSYTMQLSIVDSTQVPEREETNTLSLDLLCTNRDLPSQLPFGLVDGDLHMTGSGTTRPVRLLRKPTMTYRFPRGRGAQWRLISHLSLNHLSLSGSGVDAIKEILSLYDITRSSTNIRQISGIFAIGHRAVMARVNGNPYPVLVRGVEISVTVDESHFAGVGLFLFAQVLDHFFGLYIHTNSFTQLVLLSKHTGQEIIKCRPRNGASILG